MLLLTSETTDYSYYLFIIIIAALCIVPTELQKRQWNKFMKTDNEFFSTAYDIDTTYDSIVKEVETWRRLPKRRSLNPFRWRLPRFSVRREIQPRLYRVFDRDVGFISFELVPIDGGGTSVKTSYAKGGQSLIKAFKAKLPVRMLPSLGKVCSSCKKVYPPTYMHCPECSIPLQ